MSIQASSSEDTAGDKHSQSGHHIEIFEGVSVSNERNVANQPYHPNQRSCQDHVDDHKRVNVLQDQVTELMARQAFMQQKTSEDRYQSDDNLRKEMRAELDL